MAERNAVLAFWQPAENMDLTPLRCDFAVLLFRFAAMLTHRAEANKLEPLLILRRLNPAAAFLCHRAPLK
jgi:hypothetical protein